MNRISSVLLIALVFSTPVLAKQIWIPIVGTVNEFRTDVRVLNPSFTEELTLNAWFYPAGGMNNATVQPVTLTIPARSMRVFDNVTTSMFNLTGSVLLGAVRLESDDEFEATARIYAATPDGTLGQFEVGTEFSQARVKGALLQLESSAAFRTNLGAANPNASTASVKLRLYDRNDDLIGAARDLVLPPFGVHAPQEIRAFFATAEAAAADLSDAWVSFESDVPVIVYGSVVDNATTDPTFVPAVGDAGTPPEEPEPTVKVFNITASQWVFTSDRTLRANVGDRVRFRITSTDVRHGFTMPPYIANVALNPGVTVEQEFVLTAPGTLTFACTEASCGAGHFEMNGTFIVGSGGSGSDPGY